MVAHAVGTLGRGLSSASSPGMSIHPRNEYEVQPAWSTSTAFAPGTGLQGDDFYFPIVLSGYSGILTLDMSDFTTSGWEADDYTVWVRKWNPAVGTLKLTPVAPMPAIGVTLWDGDDFETIEDVYDPITGDPEGAFAFESVIPDLEMTPTRRLRFASSLSTAVLQFNWVFTEASEALAVDVVADTISASPGVIKVSVLNAAPGETIRFRVTGYASFTFDLVTSSAGTINGASVQIPRGLPAGTYVLRADALGSGLFGEVAFQITGVPAYPAPPTPDAPPVPVVQGGVRKWVFQDPMDGGLGDYLLELNPDSMSDPFPERYVTSEHTTSFDGQWIVWEGADRAVQWRFSGLVESQAAFEAMQDDWGRCTRRIHIHDHHNRAFLARIKGISLTPARKPGQPYRHRYEVRAEVYGWTQL